jgi:branched-chain amino acid transport system permease protein
VNLLINGLITGAVFAIAASGLVVTYSTSGIFNFAHGAVGMFCAYVYWDLRVNNNHTWPLLPKGHWPAPVALAVVLLVIAPALGAFLYLVVMRGLEDASETVKLVVPISVLLGLVSLANWIWNPQANHSIQPFFGASHKVTIFGVVLLWHDLTVLAIAAALAVALRLLLYHTRTGVSMRAVVDDRSLLELNGGRPDRVSLVSWMIGISLSALAGILITPSQGGVLSTTLLTLLVINAFAAAMFGRLRNLPLTFAGAVVLGLATRITFTRPTGLIPKSFDWATNLRLAVPMILLFLVLVVLPQDRLRGATVRRVRDQFRTPTMTEAVVGAGALVVGIVMLSRLMRPSPLITLSDAVAAGIIMLSLVLLVGFAGEASLATMALAGIAGTVMFHHVGHSAASRAGWPPYLIAIAVAAVVGGSIALPALRLRGLYLALATAAFSVGVQDMLFTELTAQRRIYPATLLLLGVVGGATVFVVFRWRGLRVALFAFAGAAAVLAAAASNGWLQRERWSAIFPNGDLQLPRPRLFGIDFQPQANFLILLTVVFAVLALLLVRLRRSAYGRRITAMKNSPAACATLGMNLVRIKLSVFMLSAAIAGLGGCLFAQEIGAVTSDRFSLFESMTMLMLLVVAGAGYVSGGFVAGLLYGAVFVASQAVLVKLAHDYHAFHGWLLWLAQFTTVLPALIGVGLGRNPAGFLDDAFRSWRDLISRTLPLFLGGVVVEAVLWLLALRHTIDNWTFVLVTAVVVVGLPRASAAINTKRAGSHEADEVPLELVGIERPFTSDDLRVIGRALGTE